MRRPLLLMNLCILAGILALAYHFRAAWLEFEGRDPVGSWVENVDAMSTTTVPTVAQSVEEQRPYPEYSIIAERNLFSESRRPDSEAEVAEEVQRPPDLSVRPVLQGVSNINGVRQATIVEMTGRAGQAQPRVVRVGDFVRGYRVDAIEDTELILRWNEHREVIPLAAAAPVAAAQTQRAADGVRIIRVGAPTPVLETIASSAADEEEQRGVEIGVVAAQQSRGQATRPGQSAQQSRATGRTGSGLTGGRSLGTAGRPSQSSPIPIGLGGVQQLPDNQ